MLLLLCSPLAGSKYSFEVLIYFWCTNLFFPLHSLESELFLCICLLSVFSLICFSPLQLLFSKLQSFNSDVLSLFFLIYLDFTNALSATSLYI